MQAECDPAPQGWELPSTEHRGGARVSVSVLLGDQLSVAPDGCLKNAHLPGQWGCPSPEGTGWVPKAEMAGAFLLECTCPLSSGWRGAELPHATSSCRAGRPLNVPNTRLRGRHSMLSRNPST